MIAPRMILLTRLTTTQDYSQDESVTTRSLLTLAARTDRTESGHSDRSQSDESDDEADFT